MTLFLPESLFRVTKGAFQGLLPLFPSEPTGSLGPLALQVFPCSPPNSLSCFGCAGAQPAHPEECVEPGQCLTNPDLRPCCPFCPLHLGCVPRCPLCCICTNSANKVLNTPPHLMISDLVKARGFLFSSQLKTFSLPVFPS